MAPEKPANCWLPWSHAREPGPPGLWGWANAGGTQTIHHVSRDGSLPDRWLKGCPGPTQSPHSDQFLHKVVLFDSPPCLTSILTHVVLGVSKTNVYCLVFPLLVSASPSPTVPVNSPSPAVFQNIINFPEMVSPSVCHPAVHREKKMQSFLKKKYRKKNGKMVRGEQGREREEKMKKTFLCPQRLFF